MAHKRLHWVFKGFVGGLFPATLEEPRKLSRAVKFVIALGLITPVVLAQPQMKDYLLCHAFTTPSHESSERIKNYCDFAAVCFQILIALFIGGIAITDPAVQAIRDFASNLDAEERKIIVARRRAEVKKLIRTYLLLRYADVGITATSLFSRIWMLFRQTYHMIDSLEDQLMYYGTLIGGRMRMAFPGGAYGVWAFILFEALILSETSKIYFDYPPICNSTSRSKGATEPISHTEMMF